MIDKRYLTLLGGFLIHMTAGSMYSWGSLNIYVMSYYKLIQDPNLKIKQGAFVFAIITIANAFTYPLAVKLAKKVGSFRLTAMTETLILFLAVYASSYMQQFELFVFLYAIIFGFMAGLLAMLPVYLSIQNFPKNKGQVTGVIFAGFGLGSLAANFMVFALVNPQNVDPFTDASGDKIYGSVIALRVPQTIRIMAFYLLTIGGIGSALMFEIDKPNNPTFVDNITTQETITDNNKINKPGKLQKLYNQDGYPIQSMREAFQQKSFYLIFFMAFFSATMGYFVVASFKTYGLEYFNDDKFITIVGSIGNGLGGICRILWGMLSDKFGFVKTFAFLVINQALLILTFSFVSSIQPMFSLWIFLLFTFQGGHFALFPSMVLEIFGTKVGSDVYGIIAICWPSANLFQSLLFSFSYSSLGYKGLFYIFFVTQIISLIILYQFKKTQDAIYQKSMGSYQALSDDSITINKGDVKRRIDYQ